MEDLRARVFQSMQDISRRAERDNRDWTADERATWDGRQRMLDEIIADTDAEVDCDRREWYAPEQARQGHELLQRRQELRERAFKAGRGLLADEQRDYDRAGQQLQALPPVDRAAARSVAFAGRPGEGGIDTRAGVPLRRDQSMAAWVQARRNVRDSAWDEPGGFEPFAAPDADLNLGKLLRGALLGDWTDAGAERRAMSGLTGTAGGFMLPTLVSANIVDLARNQTRVMQAGGYTLPMATRKVVVPRWATDPTPAWRAEQAAIAVSDASIDALTLEAKSISVITKMTRELLEDATEVDTELRRNLASVLSVSIDKAALYGTGTNNEPSGIKTLCTATATSKAGAAPTYDDLVDSVGKVEDANMTPSAFIMAPRTDRTLAKLKETSTGAYLQPPAKIAHLPRLTTNQVPINLGAGTNQSDVFTGDYSRVFVGVRTQLQIIPLLERYADTGEIGLALWWRGDVGVVRASAFHVITAVGP